MSDGNRRPVAKLGPGKLDKSRSPVLVQKSRAQRGTPPVLPAGGATWYTWDAKCTGCSLRQQRDTPINIGSLALVV